MIQTETCFSKYMERHTQTKLSTQGEKDALRSIIQRRHLKSGLHINMIARKITEVAFNRLRRRYVK